MGLYIKQNTDKTQKCLVLALFQSQAFERSPESLSVKGSNNYTKHYRVMDDAIYITSVSL